MILLSRATPPSPHALPIAVGGEKRLREAVEALVRQAHYEELFKATNPGQKAEIENHTL